MTPRTSLVGKYTVLSLVLILTAVTGLIII